MTHWPGCSVPPSPPFTSYSSDPPCHLCWRYEQTCHSTGVGGRCARGGRSYMISHLSEYESLIETPRFLSDLGFTRGVCVARYTPGDRRSMLFFEVLKPLTIVRRVGHSMKLVMTDVHVLTVMELKSSSPTHPCACLARSSSSRSRLIDVVSGISRTATSVSASDANARW